MIKFVGLSYYKFTPEGKTEEMEGYNAYFIDNYVNEERAVGYVPFKASFTVRSACEVLGISRPAEIKAYEEHVGKPCTLSFDRNKHITAIEFVA